MKINSIIPLLFISVSTFAQIAETAEEVSPLLIGKKIPDIEIISAESRKISLREIVSKQSAILLFYRGGWCPFCNAHLADVEEITTEIKALGYQIIAVSPDSPEQLEALLLNRTWIMSCFQMQMASLPKLWAWLLNPLKSIVRCLEIFPVEKTPNF
jgi:hypothetical protein